MFGFLDMSAGGDGGDSMNDHRRQLFEDNAPAITSYNQQVLRRLTEIGVGIMAFVLLVAPFVPGLDNAVPVYVATLCICLTVLALTHVQSLSAYPLGGLYVDYAAFLALGIYLSTGLQPEFPAGIFPGLLCVAPMCFVDKPARTRFFVAGFMAAHTIIAFLVKPFPIALEDTVSIVAFVALGFFIGSTVLDSRLEALDKDRRLMAEVHTDVLTGIPNWRSLFERLAVLETPGAERPSAVIMMDLDYFKQFNDTYGHAAGDEYLHQVGSVLRGYMDETKAEFFRYGGEEFVGFLYGYNEDGQLSQAERLRSRIESLRLQASHATVSIGIANCDGVHVRNYETWIGYADKASYRAKARGRNRVALYEED